MENRQKFRQVVGNVLLKDRLGILSVFKRIERWLEDVSQEAARRELECAIALAIPEEHERLKYRMTFIAYDSPSPVEESKSVESFKVRCREGKLFFALEKCAMGVAVCALARTGKIDKEVIQRFEDAWVNLDNDGRGWFIIDNPADDLGPYFEPSFEKADLSAQQIVYPVICSDGSLIALFGLEIKANGESSKGELEEWLSARLSDLSHILEHFYWAYFTQLGLVPDGFNKNRDNRINWYLTSSGRVLSATYLQRFLEVASRGGLGALPISSERYLWFYADANGLKEINDSYGHQTGNEVIRMVGAVLALAIRSVRSKDMAKDGFVVRWGGDEFIVIIALKKDDAVKVAYYFLSQARAIMSRALKSLLGCMVDVNRKKARAISEKVSISMGWQEISSHVMSEDFKDWEKPWPPHIESAMYLCKTLMKLAAKLSAEGGANVVRGDWARDKRVAMVASCEWSDFRANLLNSLERGGLGLSMSNQLS